MIAEAEYEFIRKLVYDRSRINLGPDKMELVCSRLRRRARVLEITSLESYVALLRSPAGAQEMTGLLDVISTNVTDFFREPDHFRFVQDTLLPEWRGAKERCPSDCFRAWSAACSSGEEPYSLAIVLAEFFGGGDAPDWRIMASDISTSMLRRAQEAIYPEERIRLPDPALLRRYFQKGIGRYDGDYRIKSALRSRVSFQHLNLFDAPHPSPQKFDLIFCRNVMIYFDCNTQEQLVPRLLEQLCPGGYLFVGHSESLIGIDHNLKSVRPSIYRRISAG
jgi:chemotaxis protein methyltransferase CheR